MPATRTYLLGSGFSRAISDHMPVLNELSQAVRGDLQARGEPSLPGQDTPISNNFEQWLSYLVDTPPWLSEGQKLRNRGSFLDVSESIHNVLNTCQTKAAGDPPPEWLMQLVRYWEYTSSTVITFNYDVLVELAWLHENTDRWWLHLYPASLSPIAVRTAGILGDDYPADGMRLLKLHGSLNWYYSGPDSPPGDPIYDIGIQGRSWSAEGSSPFYSNAEVAAADKFPMIVPPAAVKSPYYVNRTLQAMWIKAAQAIRNASELVVMGFSFPPSDQIVSSLIATSLQPESIVIPVDYSSGVLDRLSEVLGLSRGDSDRVIPTFAGLGSEAIPKWVEKYANINNIY